MLIFDQLKKDDPELRGLTFLILGGLGALLAGLWWVQVVMARTYQSSLETQSYRTVRIPAVRGKLLDRNGVVLAENRPSYNLSLYLEELTRAFDAEYAKQVTALRADLKAQEQKLQMQLNRRLTKQERRNFVLTTKAKAEVRKNARIAVASNVLQQVSAKLGRPVPFDPEAFEKHYQAERALPFPVLRNLASAQIAQLQEQSSGPIGVDLDVQTFRDYPNQTLAAHVLGRLQRDDASVEGEEAFFSYRLPDYRGLVGMENQFDRALRGSAGAKSMLVNNVGYRQTDQVWVAAEAGKNVVLTIDARVQQVAESALQAAYGPETRGAVVVMDVNNGDILAMASSPTLNPNHFIQGFPPGEWQRVTEMRAELNRATHERYAPGSIFKIVIGLAALESGLDPREVYHAPENPAQPGKAVYYVGKKPIRDQAPPGDYNFKRALKLSSNSYFIHAGINTGPERIVLLAKRFHLGERTGIMPQQETPGYIPDPAQVRQGWTDGNTANMSIGQDPILVTPVQMAVVISAIANGGKVLWPRLADRLEDQDPSLDDQPRLLKRPAPRDLLGVSKRNLDLLHEAMLADVEDPDGTGKLAAVPGLRICGKTGTAQIENLSGLKTGQTTWFASFAPFGSPRYAVVVMVEDGTWGGTTCAPIARKVYAAILEMEKRQQALALNERNSRLP